MQNDHEPKTPEEQIRSMYEDERSEKRIQEHLTNENDVITEQDIANLPTGIVNPENGIVIDIKEDGEVTEDQQGKEKELLEEKKVKDNEEPGIDTSWNVLGQ